jgi:putative transposase
MAKSATSEEIVAKPAVGRMSWSRRAEHVWAIGLSEVTYYRWRREFGALQIKQVKRLKELELEISRLRKAVSDLALDKLILQEAARGNC